MDHHAVAAISLTGIFLNVLGGLYLAYDLLGGQHGPLRLLTRMVTYSFLFGLGYGLGLGFVFGATAGIASGITVSFELQRTASRQDHYPLALEAVFSAIRGAAFGAGLYWMVGLRFAATFAALVTLGQVAAYSRGLRPSLDYAASRRPMLRRRHLWGTLLRTVGYMATALVCSAVARHLEHAWPFALRLGLTTGIVTGAGITLAPFIEYYADNLPERRMGVFGIWLVLLGFLLQSAQYWVSLLDMRMT